MTNRIEEAFSNYKINKMIDPATALRLLLEGKK